MLDTHGFEVFTGVFSAAEVERLADQLPDARRSLLDDVRVCAVARDFRLVRLVGAGSFAVRALLFDKTSDANWGLRWHQDLAVAVRERREVPGFGPWTMKAGVPHALAPEAVLREMVSLRIHLDDCGPESGPLRVVPCSHLRGRLEPDAVPDRFDDEHVCVAARGDVLAFKPLLLHASASSTSAARRRVLQLEYARSDLPGGLEWRWRQASLASTDTGA